LIGFVEKEGRLIDFHVIAARASLEQIVMTCKIYFSDGAQAALVIVADTGLVANACAV
jgi:hypothetical protein